MDLRILSAVYSLSHPLKSVWYIRSETPVNMSFIKIRKRCMVNGIPELAVNISCDQDAIRRQKAALDKTGVHSDFVQQDSDSHIVMRFPERRAV